MSIHELTKFTMASTWGKPSLPLIMFFVLGHGACTQMSFFPRIFKLGVPKFPKLGFL
jgi:hypothetical protein